MKCIPTGNKDYVPTKVMDCILDPISPLFFLAIEAGGKKANLWALGRQLNGSSLCIYLQSLGQRLAHNGAKTYFLMNEYM